MERMLLILTLDKESTWRLDHRLAMTGNLPDRWIFRLRVGDHSELLIVVFEESK